MALYFEKEVFRLGELIALVIINVIADMQFVMLIVSYLIFSLV